MQLQWVLTRQVTTNLQYFTADEAFPSIVLPFPADGSRSEGRHPPAPLPRPGAGIPALAAAACAAPDCGAPAATAPVLSSFFWYS